MTALYMFPSFNPKYFENPLKFDPMRWIDKDFKIKTFKDALKANGLKDIDDCSGY